MTSRSFSDRGQGFRDDSGKVSVIWVTSYMDDPKVLTKGHFSFCIVINIAWLNILNLSFWNALNLILHVTRSFSKLNETWLPDKRLI